MKSTPAMRDRCRELSNVAMDDYDRAVVEIIDDLENLIPAADALDLLKAEILKFGSQRKWCKEHLISNQYVSDILTGKVGIGKSVQAALRIRRVVMYEKVDK